MTRRLVFLSPKDPVCDAGGDVTLTNLLMAAARNAGHDVHCICLSAHAAQLGPAPGLTRVPKPPVSAARLAVRSGVRRHSLVHSRFDEDALVDALQGRQPRPDAVVAEHSYMAEPFLRTTLAGHTRLLVNTHNPESQAWARSHTLPARLDARRIRADETRIARRAHSVATFDRYELPELRRIGANRPTWLDVSLPPGRPVPILDTPPRLLFVGNGGWAPNQDASALLRRWWPDISRGVPYAELWLVGSLGRGFGGTDPSVREHGFVPDLDALMDGCRALAAPIRTGGGVRVKILHAVSRGLPVVTTSAGLGSLDTLTGIAPADDRASFVSRCRELLQDSAIAAGEGRRLHAANAAQWSSGRLTDTLERWWQA